jgi:acetyl esterase/lipase
MRPNSLLTEAILRFGKGNTSTTERTKNLYYPLMREWILSDLIVTRDVPYGARREQSLDIYVPPNSVTHTTAGKLPVVVFVPQGGFVGGDKSDLEAVNVGKFFANSGCVCIVQNHRLAPEGAWPCAAEDVASATSWVHSNVASFGGDPERIILFGHSSGATHVATYALHRDIAGDLIPKHRGLILAAGRYVLPPDDPDPSLFNNYGRSRVSAYFGEQPTLWRKRELVGNVIAPRVPIFFILGELENAMFEFNTISLMKEIADKSHNIMPRFAQVSGHNHASYFFHLGAADDPIGSQLVDFVQSSTIR